MSYEEEDTCHMRRRIHVAHIVQVQPGQSKAIARERDPAA